MTRQPARIVEAVETLEGEGVTLHRAFPTQELADLDPFLLLDHFGPLDIPAGEAKGFPDHPHRGFETVTYLLEGNMEHRDSHGNHGRLGPGDVQWMTAGSGLVHSETPGADLVRNGGRLHGFQLWVNLPRRDKMTAPKYQELAGSSIPVARHAGTTIRVIAGEALGQKGHIQTRIPIAYLHLTLQPGAEHVQPVPAQQNAFAFVIDGEVKFDDGKAPVGAENLVVFDNDGDEIRISNPAGAKRDANVLLVSGQPIGEPVARYGPFVMNSRQELVQAYEDFQAGRMGRL